MWDMYASSRHTPKACLKSRTVTLMLFVTTNKQCKICFWHMIKKIRNKTENATSGALSLKPNPRCTREWLGRLELIRLIDGFCTLLWFKLAKTFGCDISAVKRGNEQKNLTSSRAIPTHRCTWAPDTPFSLSRSRRQPVPQLPIFFAHIEPLRHKEEIARSREAPLPCFACMMPFTGDKQNAMKEQNCSHAGIGKTMVACVHVVPTVSTWPPLGVSMVRITWVKSITTKPRAKYFQQTELLTHVFRPIFSLHLTGMSLVQTIWR